MLKLDAADEEGGGAYEGLESDWLEVQWGKLSCQPWFAGDASRDQAKELLKGKPAGSFVVRQSSKAGHFAVTMVTAVGYKARTDTGFESLLILPSRAKKDSGAPGNTQYRLGTQNPCLFNTVVKLIEYYIGHGFGGGAATRQ